jgi:hypothetical protein
MRVFGYIKLNEKRQSSDNTNACKVVKRNLFVYQRVFGRAKVAFDPLYSFSRIGTRMAQRKKIPSGRHILTAMVVATYGARLAAVVMFDYFDDGPVICMQSRSAQGVLESAHF